MFFYSKKSFFILFSVFVTSYFFEHVNAIYPSGYLNEDPFRDTVRQHYNEAFFNVPLTEQEKELLEKREKTFGLFLLTIRNDNEDDFNLLLEQVNVNWIARYKNFTPLHVATYYGRISMMKKLIKSGANLDAQTVEGLTPLFYAVKFNNLDAVNILIEAGANLNFKMNINLYSVLHYAVLVGNLMSLNIIKTLIFAGADLCAKDVDGNTPLQLAVISKNKVVYDFLKDYSGLLAGFSCSVQFSNVNH